MAMPHIHSLYDRPVDPGLDLNEEPTLTQQQFQEEVEINNIMHRAMGTGEMPETLPTFYGDFSDVKDFRQVAETFIKTQNEFNSLPAKIRDRFANDPGRLLEFVHNDQNKTEGIQLGLFDPDPEPVQKMSESLSSESSTVPT